MKRIFTLQPFLRNYFYLSIIIVLTASGCSIPVKEIRAFIDEDPDWKIVERCGFEHCYPIVDYLTGKELIVRLEVNNEEDNFYTIYIQFRDLANVPLNTKTKRSLEFQPSKLIALLDAKKPLNFELYKSLNYYMKNKQIVVTSFPPGPISLETDYFIGLLFRSPYPAEAKEITLNMNDALTSNGVPIRIPIIHFRKFSSKILAQRI